MQLKLALTLSIALVGTATSNNAVAAEHILYPHESGDLSLTGGAYGSIQEAMDQAAEGDTITLMPGRYLVNLFFPRAAITLRGAPSEAPSAVILDGSGCDPEADWPYCSVVTFDWWESSDGLGPMPGPERATLENVTVTGGLGMLEGGDWNQEASYGGGIYMEWSNPTIRHVNIIGNTAGDYGGGLACGGAATLEHINIIGNEALVGGGGAFMPCSPERLVQVVISGNRAGDVGGGIWARASDLVLSQVTISGNAAGQAGGGIFVNQDDYDVNHLTLHNTIVANNFAGGEGSNLALRATTLTHIASLFWLPDGTAGVEGAESGEGALMADPLFYDDVMDGSPTDDDLHLRLGSPARDAGEPSRWDGTGFIHYTDPDGSAPDMGAYGGPDTLAVDGNGNGAPDDWEQAHGLDPSGAGDADHDGLSDGAEFDSGCDPTQADSDRDGLSDGVEMRDGSDPLDALDPGIRPDDPGRVTVPGDFPDLQSAIDSIGDGGTILVAPGRYAAPLEVWARSLTIESSEGREATTLDANGDGPVVSLVAVPATFELRGFTLTGGQFIYGGGIRVMGGHPGLEDLLIEGNGATYAGGGVHSTRASPSLKNVSVVANFAERLGAGIFAESSLLTLHTSAVSENESGRYGGGLYIVDGSADISGLDLLDNRAELEGGGLSAVRSSLNLMDSNVQQNDGGRDGGGAWLFDAHLQLIGSRVENNTSTRFGGGISARDSQLAIGRSAFSHNASGYGGAIYWVETEGSVAQSSFIANRGSNGGAIHFTRSAPVLTQVTLFANTAEESGGGLYLWDDPFPTLHNIVLAGNTAQWGDNIACEEMVCTPVLDGVLSWEEETVSDGFTGFTPSADVIVSDPHFLDSDAGDVRLLSPTSPAINAGAFHCLDVETGEISTLCTDPDGSELDLGAFGGPVGPGDRDQDGAPAEAWWPETASGEAVVEGEYVSEVDCDDTLALVYPGAPELCDDLDNDCDNIVDEDNCSTGPGCASAPGKASVMGAVLLLALVRRRRGDA